MRLIRSAACFAAGLAALTALLAAAPAPAPAPSAAVTPDPAQLVANERAFAADVGRLGVRDGFLRWLAPTGIVFQPGPVNAVKVYKALKPSAARLTWEPWRAVMSASGDMGYTTGPWEWRADSTKKDPGAVGDFVTVWRRQGDGSWKAAFDGGVSRDAQSAIPALDARLLPPGPRGGGPLARRRALYQADVDFAATAASEGVAAAVKSNGADDVIVLREGMPRLVGAAAPDSLASEGALSMMSLAQFISGAGDLGYTFGSRVRTTPTGPDSSYYLHVWQRGRTKPWELALEYVQTVPRKK